MAGQLRVDEITDEAGTGSPSFPFGLPVGYAAGGTAPAASSFTEVPSNVLEVGDPIRSVDILAIKENTNYNHQNTVLEILQEDIFTTSGTFTKATGFDDDDTVMIFLVGGGGSGGASFVTTGIAVSQGGSCGNGVAVACRYSDMPSSSFTLTIGSGATAMTQAATGRINGLTGGNTVLVNSPELLAFQCDGGAGGFSSGATRLTRGTGISFVAIIDGLGSIRAAGGPQVSQGLLPLLGSYSSQPHSATGAETVEFANVVDPDKPTVSNYPRQVFSSGGTASRIGATNTTSYNPKVPALFATGGAGSGTANGANATGIGGGGGGSVRQNTTATSGAGANGAMVVRYYRGRVSTFQVISEMER